MFEDMQGIAMGFGFGAVGGAILSDFLGLPFFQPAFFFVGGIIGGALASGAFGDVGDVGDVFT